MVESNIYLNILISFEKQSLQIQILEAETFNILKNKAPGVISEDQIVERNFTIFVT